MTKLFVATTVVDTVFAINDDKVTEEKIFAYAKQFLKEEANDIHPSSSNIKVEEVKNIDQITDWANCIYWGDNPHNMTVSDFFIGNDANKLRLENERLAFLRIKEAYFRLKDKFEPNE